VGVWRWIGSANFALPVSPWVSIAEHALDLSTESGETFTYAWVSGADENKGRTEGVSASSGKGTA